MNIEAKKEIAEVLKRHKLMPNTMGKVVIDTTPEQTIGRIEVTAVHK